MPDRVVPTDIDETPLGDESPRDHARRLARAKAAAVADAGCYVLAADTVVAVGRRILPKTDSETEARRCLALLSGRRHRVITAVVLRGPDGRQGERLVQSVVGFARLTERQIAAYLASEEWSGKAGGYAIQGQGGSVRALPVGQLFRCGRAAAVRDGATVARAGLAIAMTVRILAAASPGEVRVAAVRDGGLLDYAIWRPGAPDGVGDVYQGRVIARVPAMAGAFVALEGAEGFLPDSEGGAGLTEGDVLPVQVSRAAQGGKGPRLTARVTAEAAPGSGRDGRRLLARGPGALLETGAALS